MVRLGLTIYALFAFSVNATQGNSSTSPNFGPAIAAFEQGEYEQATRDFSTYLEHPLAQTYLARISVSEDLDLAEKWIEKAWEQDNTLALTAYVRGIVMGRQASDSIFSALSYAKKSLYSFESAVELEPENIEYRMGLMQFYLSAPGIAGGDEEKAREQLEAIKAVSSLDGIRAQLSFHQQQDNDSDYLYTLKKAIKTYPELAEFYVQHGLYLQRHEQYEQAIQFFATAQQKEPTQDTEGHARHMATYQIGRTAALSEKYLQQGHDALVEYLQNAPKARELPDKHWATFRLAQVLHFQNQNNDAKTLLNMLIKTKDEELVGQANKLLKSI